jgi:predicted enzyme related to lactoylglutathione lyase
MVAGTPMLYEMLPSLAYYWQRTSTMKLNYVIKFVSDMTRAVSFYRDVLGLPLKFESPGWTEFTTGETTLALHPASDKNPAGSLQLGFGVADIQTFYDKMVGSGVEFTMRPKTEFGALLARFLDSEGAECTVAEQ